MYQIDFSKPVKVHFIGIGGISMSGLAAVLLREGFTVTGSDSRESGLTDLLIREGAAVSYGQRAENVPQDADVVVYTAAIHPDNPEFARAVELGIPMLTRAQLLGELMRNYGMPVAVAGTHGKTTTTSMLSLIALAGDMDPTISVGGMLPAIGGNLRVGASDLFIAEACEYTNSFLSLFPKVGVILNIDADHLDFFRDLDDIRHSFHEFAKLLPEDGTLVINGQVPDLNSFTEDLVCNVQTYGTDQSNYQAHHITYDETGCGSFDCFRDGKMLCHIQLSVPGAHNVSNALAAIAAAQAMGAGLDAIREGLRSFTGADRRFQYKGRMGGVTIIDDYAHHPAEIKATLRTALSRPHRELWVAFQPHTYTRTSALLDDFAQALSLADHVVLSDIYAAREKNTIGISSEDVRRKITALGTDAHYFHSFGEIEDYLKAHCKDGDLLVTMGAGDIYKVGEDLAG